jgi:CHAT domain-containing protein/tetratricopeptide (TPR) repeat protein
MPAGCRLAILTLIGSLMAGAGRQGTDDPKLQAAVQQFFAMQEAENVDGYLSLWSKTAQKPQAAQLQFVFETGDDKFSDITIVRVRQAGDRARVRVTATRERTSAPRGTGIAPRTFRSTTEWGLVYLREDDDWKLVREGAAADALADGLLEAKTPEERSALLEEEPDLINDALVAAVARRASQLAVIRNYPAAQTAYELMRELARRTGSQRLEGEALQNIANAMYFQRNLSGALEAYESRLAIERSRTDQEGIAAALRGIATVRYTLAEYGSALTAYQEALTIQEKLGEALAISSTLISTGNVKYLQGDYPGAIADYTRSRDISKKGNNASGEADALEGMARVFIAQGDYLAALEALAGVLADAKLTNNRNEQGTALTSIGDVHFRLGNLDRARSALDEARGHFEATKNLAHAGRAWQALALVDLAAARFVLAEEGYKKSAASCGAADDKDCIAGATVGLAFAQAAQDKYQDSIASYTKGIDAFTALNRVEHAARARIGLAQAFAGSNQPEAALETARRARRDAEAIHNDDVLWRALVAEAGALRKISQPQPAAVAARGAVAAVDRLLEVAKVRPSAPVARDSSSALAMLALLQAEAGDGTSAFESAERMHVHDLRVLLAAVERDISRGMTDVEREEERALAVELVSLHAQVSRERALPKPDAGRIARLEKTIAEASERRSGQQQKLFERLPDLRLWRGLLPAATAADLPALLPDARTVLLQFVVGEETLLVLIGRRTENGVQVSSLFEKVSRKVLADRVAKLTQPETMKDPAQWRKAALELVPGLTANVGTATRAIVIAHEILWRVPFEALPAETGYLADKTSVIYAPSATALVARAPTAPPEPPAVDLVAASAPALSPEAAVQLAQTAPDWVVRTPAAADAEIKALLDGVDLARAVAIDSASATEATVRDRLPSAGVVHLASPFRINGASPLFSPLLLAIDPANDAALEAREVMNLDLRARVTILSDGSAMTMREAADEVGVVAWAWRAAGVPALVVPRWSVDAAATTPFLVELHQRLRAGESPEQALQAARAKLRRAPSTSAPFFWAGWMVLGQ